MKKICAMLLAGVMLLTACSSGQLSSAGETPDGDGRTETAASSSEEGTGAPQTQDPESSEIVIWTFSGEEERTRTVCEKYIAKPQQSVPAPEGGWTVTVKTVDAGEVVSRLREAAAGPAGSEGEHGALPDLFFFSSDDFDVLKANGLLSPLPESSVSDVNKKTDSAAAAACSSENTLYAYPAGLVSTLLLYYDKSIIAETDDLAAVIAGCAEAGRCFYAGTETTLFPEALFLSCGLSCVPSVLPDGRISRVSCDYYTENGLTAARLIRSLMGMSAFRTAEGSPMLAFSSEQDRAGAMIADSSHSTELRGILGDDYGVAAIPPVRDGEAMIPFVSEGTYAVIGVAPIGDQNKLQFCHQLSLELISSDAQRARYEANGTVPVSLSLLEKEITAKNNTASALVAQLPYVVRKNLVTDGYRDAMDRFTAELLTYGDGVKTAKLQQLLDEFSAFLMADVPKAQE